MKKITGVCTAFLSVVMAMTMLPLKVFATETEKFTPSGINYDDVGENIDGFIREREAGLASCVVSVFDRDGIVYNGYYGYSDIDNNIEADEETVYEWGSSSKMLVWISVMQQVERGNIDLNADIREYLPEGFLTKLQYPDEKITMINLMNHNAGFQESFYENQEAPLEDIYDSLEEAVRACECYQAFHVGECTSYSNWGTSLAAYIVERTSGLDYVTYVNENVFAPLEMNHTSIDPLQRDNSWVEEKRHELKCYVRYGDPSFNEDFGECRYAVQLFPAGAAIGTLEDYSKLGQALVSDDCPLFTNPDTKDEMFGATSYYGDSEFAKNCHGFWTEEHKVETLGHGGNTGGCTANLEFDPESGLGVAILTNEAGETAFCSGIPTLLFGHLTDREEYVNYGGSDIDLSGVYYCNRSIVEGAARGGEYMGQIFPLSKKDDGSYAISICGIALSDDISFVPVGENMFLMVDNGREMFVYVKGDVLELGYMDLEKSSTGILPTFLTFGFIIFGILCLVTLVVKLLITIFKKNRKSPTISDKLILSEQIIYAVSGLIFALFMLICVTSTPVFLKVSCILAALIGILSFAIGVLLLRNTIKGKERIGRKIKQYAWAALSVAFTVFVCWMQLFCFWKL